MLQAILTITLDQLLKIYVYFSEMNIMVRYTRKILKLLLKTCQKIIKKHFKNHITFTFRHVTTDEVKNVILDFKNDKAASGEIPVKILKNCGCIFDTLKYCSNQSIETCNFSDCLKTVNITPVFKNDDPLDKLNNRPVSTLPLLFKVYEKLLYNQLYEFAKNILNSTVVFEKRIVHIMHYLSYYNHGKKK